MMKLQSIFVTLFQLNLVKSTIQDGLLFEEAWEDYKLTYDKEYESLEEESFRYQNYLHSFRKVMQHNLRYRKGLVTYEMRIPRSADLSIEEFEQQKTGYEKSNVIGNTFVIPDVELYRATPVTYLNWTESGIVTSVKNQLNCGSSWAFATCAGMESNLVKEKISRVDLDLSEQQLIDCVSRTFSYGCTGSDLLFVFNSLTTNMSGISGENNYQYLAKQGNCKRRFASEGYYMQNFFYYKGLKSDETLLETCLNYFGPVVLGMYASENFLHYKTGVFASDPLCVPKAKINHVVLAVGYGVTNTGIKYWIVKNSWGTAWGERGYAKILRGKGFCKVGSDFSLPTAGIY